METPPDSRTLTLRTLSPLVGSPVPGVELRYLSQTFWQIGAAAIAPGVALLYWWLRRASDGVRTMLVLLSVFVPLGLLPVVSSAWSMVTEGALFGGLAGLGLWGLRRVVTRLNAWCERSTPRWWPGTRTTAGGVCLAMLVFAGQRSQAQDQPTATSAPQRPAVPTVIIPYGEGDPLAADRVLLPYEDYRKLWRDAHPDEVPEDQVPREATIGEALYSIDVTDPAVTDRVNVAARYILHSFRSEPVSIPLPLGRVAATSATLDGEPAILQADDEGTLRAVVSGPGVHVLDVRFELPARMGKMSGEFSLPLRPVASGRLTLTLPAGAEEVRIDRTGEGPSPIFRRLTGDDTLKVEAPIDSGGTLNVQWQPHQARGERAFIRAESTTLVTVTDTELLLVANFDLNVNQGTLSEVTFTFPEELRLQQISGPDVGGWQINGNGEERQLKLFFRRDVDESTQISAELFVALPDDDPPLSITVPDFGPVDVVQEAGQLIVAADEQLDVRPEAAEGLTQIDASRVQLPQGMQEQQMPPLRLAYRFRARPVGLSLQMEPRAQRTTAVADTGIRVRPHKSLIASRLHYEIRGEPTRTLRVMISEDWLLTEVAGDTVVDWFVEDGELVLDLGSPRLGSIEVFIEATLARDPADDEAVLESPLPLEVAALDSHLAAWLDATYDGTPGEHVGWRSIDPRELPADLPALDPQPVQFAFRSTNLEPELIFIELASSTPQLEGDAVTLIAVSDVSLDYGLTLRWRIERAATDRLTFTTSDWLQDRLELTGAGIRQVTSEAVEEGGVLWTVTLQEPVQGEYLLTGVATLPPPADRRIHAPFIRFVAPRDAGASEFVDLATQQSFAVLVNLSQDQLTAVDPNRHEAVRPESLPLKLRGSLVAQAMEVMRLPAVPPLPVWQAQHVTEQSGAAATITVATLTSVLDNDGSWRMRAEYRVRNRGQQFLAVRIPAGARVLSVVVRDQPSQVRQGKVGEEPVLLVPLPATSVADLSFLTTLVLAGELPVHLPQRAGVLPVDVDIPAPVIVSPQESREYGVPVVHTEWTVYVPDDLEASLVDDAGRSNVSLLPQGVSSLTTRLQQLQELADLNRLVTSKESSYASKVRAASNLKQLGAELKDFDSELSLSVQQTQSLEGAKQLLDQRKELLDEAQRNSLEFDVPQQDGQNVWSFDGNGVIDNSNGRKYIVGNSAVIAQDNSGEGIHLGADATTFRFKKSETPALDDKMSGLQPGKDAQVQSRAQLKGQLANQAQRLNAAAEGEVPFRQGSFEFGGRGFGGGGGLGGGGGFGAPGMGGEANPDANDYFWAERRMDPEQRTQQAAGFPTPASTETGGLFLTLDMPTEGQPLAFSKLGGSPRLTLAVRSRDTWRVGLRWAWLLLWLAVGLAWLFLRSRQGAARATGALVPVVLVVLGLFGGLLLSAPANWLSAAVLALGVLWLTLQSAFTDHRLWG